MIVRGCSMLACACLSAKTYFKHSSQTKTKILHITKIFIILISTDKIISLYNTLLVLTLYILLRLSEF